MIQIIGEEEQEYINGFRISAWIMNSWMIEQDGRTKIEYFYGGVKKHEVFYNYPDPKTWNYSTILRIAEQHAPSISELRKKFIDEL